MTDHIPEDEADEEIERFDDFTIASSWERFISEIEAVCRLWLADGRRNLRAKGAVLVGSAGNLYNTKKELKYNSKSYSMEYYFEDKHSGKADVWDDKVHDLQLSFGVQEFLVISPQSASGVVLDLPEASKLLSAVAIALSNSSCLWPSFVPVHDPSRKAFMGIQNMGTVLTRRFEADYLGSQVPIKLMHLEGLYDLFVAKFAFSTVDFSMHLFRIQFTMRLTYKTLPNDDGVYLRGSDANNKDSSEDSGGELQHQTQWDGDCPWSEWYSAEDPVKGFKLITVWPVKIVATSLDMAEVENSSPHEAESWLLLPTFSDNLNEGQKGSTVGFASQLSYLVKALDASFEAQFLEDFVSVESGSDNLRSSAIIPPPTVVDRILGQLFHEGAAVPQSVKGDHKKSRAIKGAPLDSLFAQFCLQALWFGNCNIRAVATLWIEFVREVRWYWEESQTLPRMPVDAAIDLSTCVINQKLKMLAICIERKREANPEFYDASASYSDMEVDTATEDLVKKRVSPGKLKKKSVSNTRAESSQDAGKSGKKAEIQKLSSVAEPLDNARRGSSGFYGNMMLLNSQQRMHAPFTQDPPLMTEDMHEERLRAVEAFGDSFNFSAQLERDILLSDMSSFKAANPEAVFEDFIRWHSPGDWESDTVTQSGKGSWPPSGCLSKRMNEQGNSWRKLWDEAPALPADEQKPLLDPNREGEKVIHYLETLKPYQLLEQMVCTAFRASADTINQTTFGDLSEMRSKMDQLYATVASTLRPLQANKISEESEVIQDLDRLCNVFEHVEKLMCVAASLHRKFVRAPRLSASIFGDYYKYYIPRMGTGSPSTGAYEEYDQKIKVGRNERDAVVELFTFPTANQSWRKVLSMGNLLNGHEPTLREIIFSMKDNMGTGNNQYSSSSSVCQEIETYRMYISGSSNDLRVALSAISWD